jgi:hypothetical protein
VKFFWRTLGLMCGGALAAAPLRAAEPAADTDFLEYLGSVDSSEAGWHEYLASTDVGKAAKPAASPPTTSPPAASPPAQSTTPPSAPPALNTPAR